MLGYKLPAGASGRWRARTPAACAAEDRASKPTQPTGLASPI